MKREIKLVKSAPFMPLAKLAYNWRKQRGGVLPVTIEETQRNIAAYCISVAHLN